MGSGSAQFDPGVIVPANRSLCGFSFKPVGFGSNLAAFG
jgi:hypothetical protein